MVACLPTAVCTSADVLQLFLGVLVFFSRPRLEAKQREKANVPFLSLIVPGVFNRR